MSFEKIEREIDRYDHGRGQLSVSSMRLLLDVARAAELAHYCIDTYTIHSQEGKNTFRQLGESLTALKEHCRDD